MQPQSPGELGERKNFGGLETDEISATTGLAAAQRLRERRGCPGKLGVRERDGRLECGPEVCQQRLCGAGSPGITEHRGHSASGESQTRTHRPHDVVRPGRRWAQCIERSWASIIPP